MPLPLLIAAVAAPIVGGVVSHLASSGDREKAEKAMAQAMEEINSLKLPESQAREVMIAKLKSVGVWKPEMEKTIDAGVSKVSQIEEDPALREEQTATMDALRQIADTGMTATGRAEYNQARAKVQQDVQAKQQQILQQMQARGMGGAGAELAMSLSSAQGGANQQAEAADRIAASQEQAKMAALGQLGGMAGQVRAQDFGVNQSKAGAADAFQMFNVNNQVGQQARNVGATNEALKYDVMNNQRLSDQNTTNANNELYRQRTGEQTDWQNKLGLSTLKANAALGKATQHQQAAQNTTDSINKVAGGVGAAAGAGAAAMKTSGPRMPATTAAMGVPPAPEPDWANAPDQTINPDAEENDWSNL